MKTPSLILTVAAAAAAGSAATFAAHGVGAAEQVQPLVAEFTFGHDSGRATATFLRNDLTGGWQLFAAGIDEFGYVVTVRGSALGAEDFATMDSQSVGTYGFSATPVPGSWDLVETADDIAVEWYEVE